jgi:hypothetical protein
LAVNGDSCYDFGIGPCSNDATHYDLEAHGRSDPDGPGSYWGENVEGRVAGTLYDLMDSAGDGYDSAARGFDWVSYVALLGDGHPNLFEFWSSFGAGSRHHEVRSVYQNTIDYDTAPTLGVPDQKLLADGSRVLDLRQYAEDAESLSSQLTYWLWDVSEENCGVSIQDDYWLHVDPQPGWTGFCWVDAEAYDSIESGFDGFWIDVVPATERIYISLAAR